MNNHGFHFRCEELEACAHQRAMQERVHEQEIGDIAWGQIEPLRRAQLISCCPSLEVSHNRWKGG